MLKDEEMSHNCLADFSVSRSYFVGHIYAQRYIYVASEFSIGRVLMRGGNSFEVKIENVGSIKGKKVFYSEPQCI